MFAPYLGQQVCSVFYEFVMLELNFVFVSPDLVEAVHVELSREKGTCRTKDDMLECLKYLGRTISSKALTLWMRNELTGSPLAFWHPSAQLTML